MPRLWLLAPVVAAVVALAAHQSTAPSEAPPADVLPRAAWGDSIRRMQQIRDGSEGTATPTAAVPADFAPPLAWYERRAPASLPRATGLARTSRG
jgi:hypothetical protein